jgi:uncharacterized protein
MPVTPTYPGVYIEEIPSGVHTIVGVATSIGSFIDYFNRGPLDHAVHIFNMGDFERDFGGLDTNSEASYGIQQFFLNGGTEAWIVRVGANGSTNYAAATVVLGANPQGGGTQVLRVTAGRQMQGNIVPDPGQWGNSLWVDVDYNTSPVSADLFNLFLTQTAIQGGRTVIVSTETYLNLTMQPGLQNAIQVVNEQSKLIQLSRDGGWPAITAGLRPAITGTFGLGAPAVSVPATGDQFRIAVAANSATVNHTVTLTFAGAPSVPQFRPILESAIQAAGRAASPPDPYLSGASVQLLGDGSGGNPYRFRVLAGRGAANFDPNATLTFSDVTNTPATDLGLVTTPNFQLYALAGGVDPVPPGGNELRGIRANKTGLYALEDVDLFNILCIPRAAVIGETDINTMNAVVSEVEAYCDERRAFFIVDLPYQVNGVQDVIDWLNTNAGVRDNNSALYFPNPRIPDPLNGYRLRTVGASGTVAGLYARTDTARGVWKAPAGIDATLRNVSELNYSLTDGQNGALNPLGINCLRNFPVYGNICWGSRTLEGADVLASDWKYVPVRRLALFLEESLYRGTKWAVFEPNDEPLWAQLRLNVGAFMHDLFRQGAFQGQTPRDAYFVKCDKETTTQNDINQGIVNVLVGFAPLKPAEFVIIQIQQIVGQIQT